MPISLSPGHIRTAEFKINLEGAYELYVEFRPVFDDGSGTGGLRCPTPLPRTAWSFSKGDQVITTGNGGGNEALGGIFSAGAGRYTLDLDVRDDGSCLNAASPHLIIAAFEYEHPEVDKNLIHAFFLSLLLAVTGFNLFIHSYSARRLEEPACSLTEPGPQPPLTDGGSGLPEVAVNRPRTTHPASSTRASEHDRLKLRRSYMWPFQQASWFGLIASFICLFVLIPICVVPSFRLVPTGLPIHLFRPAIGARAQLGVEPLLVRVESAEHGVVRSLYIGSRRVPSENFDTVLRKALAVRPPTWPVYVEGEPDMEWQSVVKAIDEIRGLHAEVVLLTPSAGRR